jgi:CRP/FNR family transcriptional regulator, anaerobic regulatory protein
MPDRHALSEFAFLSELSAAGRSRLLDATRLMKLLPNSKVIERGAEVTGAYLVQSGALRVFYISPEGREGTLYWVDPGQSCILALNCLFSRLVYPAWVDTEHTETEVAIISGDVFRELYLTEPSLQNFTFASLSTRLFELMTLLQETASLGLEQRAAAFLLRRSGGGQALETTHEQIAHHLGSSREVVSRVLRNLAKSGAIKLAPGSIAIVDATKLRGMVEQQ